MQQKRSLPSILKPFETSARKLLEENRVRSIEFSGPTYQVQMIDPQTEQPVWALVQLDSHGQWFDGFCSCQNEESPVCVHLAAAWLRLYKSGIIPFHERFEQSFWHKICRLYVEKIQDPDSDFIKIAPGSYRYPSSKQPLQFGIKAKTAECTAWLTEAVERRVDETEATSLKFSNLSEEELQLWREGRPSPDLRYLLSFWNDLAQRLFVQQDEGVPYEIRFEGTGPVPHQIAIDFPDLKLIFTLTEDELAGLIASLSTVQSPLVVHDPLEEGIQRMTYDSAKGVLQLEPSEASIKRQGQPVGPWLYVPGEGFYWRESHPLLKNLDLSGDQIPQFLREHPSLVRRLLHNTKLNSEPLSLSYTIAFDKSWKLHLVAYAFVPGDLSSGEAKLFDDWVYVPQKGFYPIKEARFPKVETVILKTNIGSFVQQERDWLDRQEGFQTHLSTVFLEITYVLSADNRLTFARTLSVGESQSVDFGAWVYVAGKGFYSKTAMPSGLPWRGDVAILADQIPVFIKVHQPELQLVPGFFSQRSPIKSSKLHVELIDEGRIRINPYYEIQKDYLKKKIRFFGDFTYVDGEGFHEIPASCRFPDRYREPLDIVGDHVPFFITEELDKIQNELVVEVDPRLDPPERLQLYVHKIVQEEENRQRGWFGVSLFYHTERGEIPLTTIWAALKKKQQYLLDPAGRLDLTSRRFEWISLVPKGHFDKKRNLVWLSPWELLRLHAFEELRSSKDSSDAAMAQKLLHDLLNFQVSDAPDFSELSSALRSYQQLGIQWLWFLYRYGLSGLLCDEMGLGKTHQAMALLAAIRKDQAGKGPFRALVVCPTSVIFHWQEKLQKFLPHAKVCTFHGTTRNITEYLQDGEILLTSYGIWRREHAQLENLRFDLAIFDEIQAAKNRHSRLNAALRHVNAGMRLGLTGTPIENHLGELKALFDIILPGYMPTDSDYNSGFLKPIERTGDPDRRQLLSRMIHPFVLRRRKADVLTELPEKIEEVSHCEMTPDQQMIYLELLQQSRARLVPQLQDASNPVPYLHIFALLSSLKQICDHPAVYYKTPKEYKKYSSGKWELFLELIDEARESGQKVVVFSHYLAMLDIIEDYLHERGIGYASLRGATRDRRAPLERFHNDPKCEFFLGSLHAAGLGIDLTAGSVVIHYDRWWNAAREQQATDRVHRIGQTRGVQVFKLVTKETVEERIDALIAKKGRLMESIVGADDHRVLKSMNREELLQLLQALDLQQTGKLS